MPKAQLKAAVRRLRDDPSCGKPLGDELRGCQSIRIGGSENRVVYRQRQPTANGGEVQVEILAVGRRRASEVYETAKRRL